MFIHIGGSIISSENILFVHSDIQLKLIEIKLKDGSLIQNKCDTEEDMRDVFEYIKNILIK